MFWFLVNISVVGLDNTLSTPNIRVSAARATVPGPLAAREAAKSSTVRYHIDQSGARDSYYIFVRSVFTIAYGLLVHFVT